MVFSQGYETVERIVLGVIIYHKIFTYSARNFIGHMSRAYCRLERGSTYSTGDNSSTLDPSLEAVDLLEEEVTVRLGVVLVKMIDLGQYWQVWTVTETYFALI